MQLSVAEILVLMVTVLEGVQSELHRYGQNVCTRTETYQEKYLTKKLRPREVIQKKRCWNPLKLFSCEKTVVIWEEHMEYETVPRSRLVSECCPGYVEDREERECVPNCRSGCIFGKCVAPDVCACDRGFRGRDCRQKCPEGYWGDNCAEECNCLNNGRCDNVLGCACQSGWIGLRCESACQDGYYGPNCNKKCECNGDNCNHITGECLTTTELTTTTSIASTVETLLPFTTTERDETSTSESTQSHSSERTTTTNDVSTTEVFDFRNIFETWMNPDRDIITELSPATTEKTDPISSERVSETEMKLSENDMFESTQETVFAKRTTETGTFFNEITTVKIAGEEDEEKTNLINIEMVSEREQEGTNNPEAKSTTLFPLSTVNEPNIRRNKTSWISLTARNEDINKNKTDNFIFEGKGNSRTEAMFKFLHFLPSFSVISAASFLIIIIAARWLIVKHRRKTRMLVVVAPEKGNVFQSDERIKFQAENLFWVNNCTVNPVYMSDVDLNHPTPVMETFKPLDKGVKTIL